MAAVESSIVIDQGEDWSHIYQYVAPNGSYVIMHGPAAFVIHHPRTQEEIYRLDTLVFEPGTAVGGFPGKPAGIVGEQVRVTLPRMVTLALPTGQWDYGVTVTCGSQTVPLVRGDATVRPARGKVG